MPAFELSHNHHAHVRPWDPRVLSGATLLLVLAALIAGLIPERRATRIEPMVALRHD
jgi:ABC-type lipoprotein release transport system permease subunit